MKLNIGIAEFEGERYVRAKDVAFVLVYASRGMAPVRQRAMHILAEVITGDAPQDVQVTFEPENLP